MKRKKGKKSSSDLAVDRAFAKSREQARADKRKDKKSAKPPIKDKKLADVKERKAGGGKAKKAARGSGEIVSKEIFALDTGMKGGVAINTMRLPGMAKDQPPLIDLRKFYIDNDKNHAPTAKGVALDYRVVKKLIPQLKKLVARIEEKYGLEDV